MFNAIVIIVLILSAAYLAGRLYRVSHRAFLVFIGLLALAILLEVFDK